MEWKEVTLGEITNLVIDYRGKTPLKLGSSWSDSGYRALSAKNIKTGQIVAEDSIRFVDEELYRKWMKDEVKKGDILITSEAPFGQIYYWDSDEKIVLSQRLFDVRLNDEVCHKYVYYFMTSHRYQKDLEGRATGTTVTGLRQPELLKSTILLPPLSAQRSISSILSSLDRKIELNNKINADLEEMAQAIFKNWFVDFEPFKDGKFVDSELGMIPEGWKVGSYSEMIESLISGDWGKETPQGNYTHEVACVRGCDFQDINNGVRGKTPQRYILEKNYQAKHLKDKDILVEISGGTATVSTGRTSLVTEELLKKYKHDIVCTNFCKVLRPLSQFSSYVYYSWKYKYDNDIMFGYENGTSGIKNFAIKDFIEKEPVLIPKEQDIVEFQKIIDNLQKQKQIKGTENSRLSLLRDTLLPRLMSGELEVPE